MAGNPGANWLVSEMTAKSQASRPAFSAMYASRLAPPTSSSPSITNRTFTGSRPAVFSQASAAFRWVSIWPLSSVAPRA